MVIAFDFLYWKYTLSPSSMKRESRLRGSSTVLFERVIT